MSRSLVNDPSKHSKLHSLLSRCLKSGNHFFKISNILKNRTKRSDSLLLDQKRYEKEGIRHSPIRIFKSYTQLAILVL